MKNANIAHLKNNLSSYLKYVGRGGRVRVMDRDNPVADIIPVKNRFEGTTVEENASLKSLEASGIIRRGTGRLREELLKPPSGAPSGALRALLEERDEGR
jgi:antitoxin (DNA-binding transcriptional repressor) of toxin-antitoxin stability system